MAKVLALQYLSLAWGHSDHDRKSLAPMGEDDDAGIGTLPSERPLQRIVGRQRTLQSHHGDVIGSEAIGNHRHPSQLTAASGDVTDGEGGIILDSLLACRPVELARGNALQRFQCHPRARVGWRVAPGRA